MAHFAKLGVGNIVERIEVVHNDIATTEQAGVDFLNNLYQTRDVWKQCSYNTIGGEHKFGGTQLRKNYPAIGDSYSEELDAFIPIKPFDSFTLNEDTCLWEPPIAYPTDGQSYNWNEENQNWDVIEQ